jgi:hypothetical protein
MSRFRDESAELTVIGPYSYGESLYTRGAIFDAEVFLAARMLEGEEAWYNIA